MSYIEERNIKLEDRYNVIIQKGLPKKSKDSGSFNLPVYRCFICGQCLAGFGGKHKSNSFDNAEENR